MRRQGGARDEKRPGRTALAALGGVAAFAVVFGLASLLVDRLVAQQYPAPEQAAVWSMMGRFVAATIGLAAAAQAWWWLRRR
jgi:hypothetical protein